MASLTNLAKEFDLHSRFGCVVLGVVVVERLAVSGNLGFLYPKIWTPPPFKILFNDIYILSHEVVFNCARRRICSIKMVDST